MAYRLIPYFDNFTQTTKQSLDKASPLYTASAWMCTCVFVLLRPQQWCLDLARDRCFIIERQKVYNEVLEKDERSAAAGEANLDYFFLNSTVWYESMVQLRRRQRRGNETAAADVRCRALRHRSKRNVALAKNWCPE